jgi:hypothetical protein
VYDIGVTESLSVEQKTAKERAICAAENLDHTNSLLVELHCDWIGAPQGIGAYYFGGSIESKQFAMTLMQSLADTARKPRQRFLLPDVESRHGRLGIVRDTASLACLVEMGALAGYDLEYMTGTDDGPQEIARAIADGICEYAKIPILSPAPEAPSAPPAVPRTSPLLTETFIPTISAMWHLAEHACVDDERKRELQKKLHETNELARAIAGGE